MTNTVEIQPLPKSSISSSKSACSCERSEFLQRAALLFAVLAARSAALPQFLQALAARSAP